MREIKFRAWQDNQMITSPLSSNYGLQRFFASLYEDAPLMQYTGLKDKNGKEIYEGDIIKIDGTKMYQNCKPKPKKGEYLGFFKVEINVGDYGISVDFEHINGYECVTHIMGDTANVNSTNIEIIGNIHENPELLKQEKV